MLASVCLPLLPRPQTLPLLMHFPFHATHSSRMMKAGVKLFAFVVVRTAEHLALAAALADGAGPRLRSPEFVAQATALHPNYRSSGQDIVRME